MISSESDWINSPDTSPGRRVDGVVDISERCDCAICSGSRTELHVGETPRAMGDRRHSTTCSFGSREMELEERTSSGADG